MEDSATRPLLLPSPPGVVLPTLEPEGGFCNGGRGMGSGIPRAGSGSRRHTVKAFTTVWLGWPGFVHPSAPGTLASGLHFGHMQDICSILCFCPGALHTAICLAKTTGSSKLLLKAHLVGSAAFLSTAHCTSLFCCSFLFLFHLSSNILITIIKV